MNHVIAGNVSVTVFYEYIVKDPANGTKMHKCTICGKQGQDRGNLRKHVENVLAVKLLVPEMLLIIILQRCIKLFKSNSFYNTDGASNFGLYIQKLPENGPKAQQCTICGKSFSDNSSAQKHVENIHFPGWWRSGLRSTLDRV